MGKRSVEADDAGEVKAARNTDSSVPKTKQEPLADAADAEMGEFEDPYGDEFESDGEIIEIDSSGEAAEDEEVDKTEPETTSSVYLPHRAKPLGPDEVMEADPSVYEMLHNVNLPWPCLSVDVIRDGLGEERRSYPASMMVATGTQASVTGDNETYVLRLTQLGKTLVNEESEDEDEDEEQEHVEPVMESESIARKAETNRIRVEPHGQQSGDYFMASMMSNGEVSINNYGEIYRGLTKPGNVVSKKSKRGHVLNCHGNVEGYGVDWSPVIGTGALLTGDVSGRIFLTNRTPSKWDTGKVPYAVNDASIEDIQWSQSEKTVFATAGCDGYVRIWDTRSKKHKPSISVVALASDVNVISWSDKVNYLLASGHDDGSWAVWDLRNFRPGSEKAQAVAEYSFHKSPITSIAFKPADESIVAVSSEDNTVTLWDLAVEADDEEIKQQKRDIKEMADIPPQLLFVHWQKHVKEVRWHPQIPGALVSTGADGLNVWKTISV